MTRREDPRPGQVLVDAPAKLNFGLEVLGRRPDGYHELVTIFQSISLFDRIEITVSGPPSEPGVRLEVLPRSLDLGPVSGNLAFRAAEALLDDEGLTGTVGVDLRLRKRIPAGAGLGGGSADAAAVLVGLTEALKLSRTPDSLLGLGRQLGADVPFCLFGGTRLGQGVGEILTEVPPIPPSWWVVVFPNVSVPTSSIFSVLSFGLTPPGPLARIARRKFAPDIWTDLADLGIRNDLESAVLVAAPVVGDVLEELRTLGSPFAQVTGSGSAVYGRVSDRETGRNWVRVLKRRGWWARLVRPTRHGCRLLNPRTGQPFE